MAVPDVPDAAEELLDELAVCQPGDEQRGSPFRLLVGAIAVALGPLHDLVRDTEDGPGWSAIADPDRTPDPQFTAQLNGVVLTRGASDEQHRSELRIGAGLRRGSPGALREAVQATLTGARQVTIIERDGDPYELLVISYEDETPDPDAAEAAARSQKPAGLLLTYRVDPGWSIGQLEAAYAGLTIADLEADFASVGALESNLPTP